MPKVRIMQNTVGSRISLCNFCFKRMGQGGTEKAEKEFFRSGQEWMGRSVEMDSRGAQCFPMLLSVKKRLTI